MLTPTRSRYPPAYHTMVSQLELAILAEKKRRRGQGDYASVSRFDAERTRIMAEFAANEAFAQECRDEVMTAYLSGDDWGWWKYMPPPQTRHIQAFLLGEEVGSDADGPSTSASATTPPPARKPAEPTAAPALPSPPPLTAPTAAAPIGNFPFEEGAWTPADDAAMYTWRTKEQPPPQRWTEIQLRLEQAIAAEVERRRRAGDTESVARFLRGRARWSLEYDRNADFQAQSREEVLEATLGGEDWGLWKWLPPVQRRGIQSFLRGEPVSDTYTAGPTDPTPSPHTFPFEEGWGVEDEVDMCVRRDDDPYPAGWSAASNRLELAIVAEKTNRRARGDSASIARFDTERARFLNEWNVPELRQRAEEQRHAMLLRGEVRGFWQWMQAPLTRLFTASDLRQSGVVTTQSL